MFLPRQISAGRLPATVLARLWACSVCALYTPTISMRAEDEEWCRVAAGTADGASTGGGAGSQPATPRTVAGISRLAFSPVTEMTEEFMKDAGRQM